MREKIDIFKLITPIMVALIGAGVAYLLSTQSNLMASVSQHHMNDIERKEAMDTFITKAEMKECVRRLDEKVDSMLMMLKEWHEDADKGNRRAG